MARSRGRGSRGRARQVLGDARPAVRTPIRPGGREPAGVRDRAGTDATRFGADLAARRYQPRVREDFRSGVSSGVNGTPTFFVNGARYYADWDIESLLGALQQVGKATLAPVSAIVAYPGYTVVPKWCRRRLTLADAQ